VRRAFHLEVGHRTQLDYLASMAVIPTFGGKRVYETYPEGTSGPFDVIVIGAGMGGMSCAAALAKYGHRVLVLEQHYLPGGFTHMFGRKGYEWDVGVHAIGEMRPGDMPFEMLNWLTDGAVRMVPLGNPYDRFEFHDGYSVHFPDTKAAFVADLKSRFPEQAGKLDRYFEAVEAASKQALAFFAFKSLPETVERLGNRALYAFRRNPWEMTTSQVLDEIGIEGKLRTLLTVHWGYIGSTPDESSFPVHALTHTHFWNGAYYPEGGAKAFAEHMLRNVLEAGGRVVTRASVETIVTENGRAVGVRMKDGVELRAKVVVSATGAKTTVRRLAPPSLRESRWGRDILSIPDSPSYICLNLGFEGDITEHGAAASNLWLYETWDNNDKLWDVSDKASKAPILYCSFPSLKDPRHDPGKKQRHTGECVTFVPWSLFEPWKDTELDARPADYEALKKDIEERLLAHLRARLPGLMSMLRYHELSTPLTTEHFTRAARGAIYGLEATPKRFLCSALRTRTPLPGFYMSGVDIGSLGVVGGMSSGMLTAASIDPRVYRHLI
jgi:all-trans-retinol 13,14-reductase